MVERMVRILKVDVDHPEKEIIREAARIIKEGGLVAFPTETVYGLGADALNKEAVKRIFEVKGRPLNKPISILIGRKEDLKRYIPEIPKIAEVLMEKFWPGPLTLIFKASFKIPDILKGKNDTIGIRMPDCKIALEIIQTSKIPLACPSANLSERSSPIKASQVARDLGEKIDLILDGGETRIGVESTVLDLTTSLPTILREGFLSKEKIVETIGKISMSKTILLICTGNTCRSPMAEALLKRMLKGQKGIKVFSAGIQKSPFNNPTKEAIETMKAFTLDISTHQTTSLSKDLVKRADLILVMAEEHRRFILNREPKARGKVFLLKEFAGYKKNLNIKDPLGFPYNVYQKIAKEIKEALDRALPKILEYLRK